MTQARRPCHMQWAMPTLRMSSSRIGLGVAGLCAAGWGERGVWPGPDRAGFLADAKSRIGGSRGQGRVVSCQLSAKATTRQRIEQRAAGAFISHGPTSRCGGSTVAFGSGESAFHSHAPGSRTGRQAGSLCHTAAKAVPALR